MKAGYYWVKFQGEITIAEITSSLIDTGFVVSIMGLEQMFTMDDIEIICEVIKPENID